MATSCSPGAAGVTRRYTPLTFVIDSKAMAEFVYVDNSTVFIEGRRVSAVQRGRISAINTGSNERGVRAVRRAG